MLPVNGGLSLPPSAQAFRSQVEKPVAFILQSTIDHNGALRELPDTSILNNKYQIIIKYFSNNEDGAKAFDEAESLGKIKLLWIRLHGSPTTAGKDFVSYDCFLGRSTFFDRFKKLDSCARIIIEGCCTAQQTNLDKFLHGSTDYHNLPDGTRNFLKEKNFGVYNEPRRLFYPTNPERTEGLIFSPSYFGVSIRQKSTDKELGTFPSLNVASAIACLTAENRMVFAAKGLIQPGDVRFVSTNPVWVKFDRVETDVLMYDRKVKKIGIKPGGIAFEIPARKPSSDLSAQKYEVANAGFYSIGEVIEKARNGIEVVFIRKKS